MGDTTFWFTTFEIEGVEADITNFDPSQSREDVLREQINEYVRTDDAVAESSTGKWYFGSIDERGDFLYGQFGKVYTDKRDDYDEEAGVFVEDAGTNVDASYCMFIIYFPLNLLIYNTKNRVGYQQFRQNFASGYNQRHGGDMTIEFIQNDDDFEEVIERHRVLNAEFDLTPSNPGSEPEWESLDNHIHEMVASHLGIEAEAIEGSSLDFDDELLAEIAAMSQSPYGEFEVFYDDEGYVKKIASGDGEPIIQQDEEPDGLGGLRAMADDLVGYASTFLDGEEQERDNE